MEIETAPLVKMRGIKKYFGAIQALKGVDIDVNRGEVLGIVGDNGAGKSTLVKCLSGAHPPDTGAIYFEGEKVIISEPKHARNLGIETIYQNLALVDTMTTSENVFLGREKTTRIGLLDNRFMESETKEILAKLKLQMNVVNSDIRNLSGGERQCITVGRSIYFNCKVLIMDEPTAALGVEETKMVQNLMYELAKEHGIAIIFISHNLNDIFKLSDRVTVLKNGNLVGTIKTSESTIEEVLSMIILGQRKN